MPSPVDSTVPVSLTSICLPYVLICSRRMRLISSALISIFAFSPVCLESSALQLAAHPLELRADAAVPHLGSQLRDQSPDDLRIAARVEDDRAPRRRGQDLVHAPQVLVAQRLGAGDCGADAPDL